MKNRIIIIIMVIIELISNGCNQKVVTIKNNILEATAHSTIQSFFSAIGKGDSSAMITLLKQNDNIDLTDSLTIDLLNKFDFMNQNSGTFISDTLLRKKTLNNDVGVYCYLAKYEKKFYKFTFVFYNNGKEVKIYRFSFDESIDIELEEGIKLYVN